MVEVHGHHQVTICSVRMCRQAAGTLFFFFFFFTGSLLLSTPRGAFESRELQSGRAPCT